MSEQIASAFILVAALFVAASVAGYVPLQRPHHPQGTKRLVH